MKPQCIDNAIATEDLDLAINLGCVTDEPKSSLRDLFMSCTQVGTALSLCWALHLFA